MPSISNVLPESRRAIVRCFAPLLAATMLAACAQSTVATRKSEPLGTSRQAALERSRESRVATTERLSVVRRHEPDASTRHAARRQFAAHGVASFYSDDTETASGEKFDPAELTAAHPTLPFGTRLRVTNLSNGQSVTVRVNDRGPYVQGRVVDVSYSAAQALGMERSGIANVKLDVLH